MIIRQSKAEIITPINNPEFVKEILALIEIAGRTCYKSEDKITESSSREFVKMLISREHLSVLEHQSISVRFIVDRGISHELVRHRIASFSQESTRYCNYLGAVSYINPSFFNNKDSFDIWYSAVKYCEEAYKSLINLGESPQIARSVLPNSLKTEIVITANLREWRLIFQQRCAKEAHPQMREVMIPLLFDFTGYMPDVFGDLDYLIDMEFIGEN